MNLALHVTGHRADGYHLLDSLVMFADCADVLEFSHNDQVNLKITGDFAGALDGLCPRDNLIFKSAKLLNPDRGANIHLQKYLPVAAGIGGGSADGAAALRGLAQLWNLPAPDLAAQLQLGADVPVCFQQTPARIQGVGEIISPVSGLPDLPCVLVNPNVPVSTSDVFKKLTNKENKGLEEIPKIRKSTIETVNWLARQRNDLQAPAIDLAPQIADVLAQLQTGGACLVRMSGSGATCFGLFATDKQVQATAVWLQEKHPSWWVQPTTLRGR